ncbi:MAG: hypothetical protein GTO02_07995 [Candidatus Dadabacteria bacterium]|nr:hypothetical protein [Candidatus Dadabacteria bacterium]
MPVSEENQEESAKAAHNLKKNLKDEYKKAGSTLEASRKNKKSATK